VDNSNNLFAGGQFTTAGGSAANRIARWNGSAWGSLGGGTNNTVRALSFDSAGQLYAAGDFTSPVGRIARWNGTSWTAMGNGLNAAGYAVANQPVHGNLLVGGNFTRAGANNNYSSYIAHWTTAVGVLITNTITYTLYTDNLPIEIGVNTLGSLNRINIQRHNRNHPNATTPLEINYYWEIEGLDNGGNPAAGFSVTLKFPAAFTPDGDDKVCRFAAGVWDCVMSSYDDHSITRSGVTAFSEWTLGNDAGPTSIEILRFTAGPAPQAEIWLGLFALILGLAFAAQRRSKQITRPISRQTLRPD
jgi:hypothetical protein